jgi:ADP-heptose:LPS heptosyltransferase
MSSSAIPPSRDVPKILLIRLSSIGDIVLTSPVARCIRTQRPDCEVHFATKAAYADLVRFDPHVSDVHEFRGDGPDLIRRLRAERFDMVVDLHASVRTWWLTRALGRPTITYCKHRVARWLRVTLRLNTLPTDHVVDRYVAPLEALGVRNDGLGLALHIPPERCADPSHLPESHRRGYVALAVGAAHATKRLPLHRLIGIAQELERPVVLIGGPGDAAVAAQIADAVGHRVHNAVGRYDLLASASLLRDAAAVIAHDSAAMHIAAAFQRPVVSVWGSTIPAFGMGPYLPQHPERAAIVEVPSVACRPCTTIGRARCPKGHLRCLELHDHVQIAQLARAMAVPAVEVPAVPSVLG